MRIQKNILFAAAGMLITLACGLTAPAQPSQTGLETAVAETVQALTAGAPSIPATEAAATQQSGQLTPDGTPVETAEISFFIPNGVANDATTTLTTEVEYPYINPSLGDMPQHVVVTLNLYTETVTLFTPRIMIFRADEYANYSEMTTAIISTLRSLQYTDGQPLPEELGATFTAQVHALNFQNGKGIRYLTEVLQGFAPVTNEELFYYYQGITSDGKYFVQAVLPINAAFLPANGRVDTVLPPDGIPFNMDDFPGYLEAVKQKLNSTETYNFNPYLDALDEMLASLHVRGF